MKNFLLRFSAVITAITACLYIALLATGGTYTAMAVGIFAVFSGMFYLGEVERNSVDIHSTYW